MTTGPFFRGRAEKKENVTPRVAPFKRPLTKTWHLRVFFCDYKQNQQHHGWNAVRATGNWRHWLPNRRTGPATTAQLSDPGKTKSATDEKANASSGPETPIRQGTTESEEETTKAVKTTAAKVVRCSRPETPIRQGTTESEEEENQKGQTD